VSRRYDAVSLGHARRATRVTRQVIHPGMFKEFTREAGMGLEYGADANLSVGG
jgi:hypothetical protein